MEIVKLSSKGQIVPNKIRLKPAPIFTPSQIKDIAGVLAKRRRKPLDAKATAEAIGWMLMEADAASKS